MDQESWIQDSLFEQFNPISSLLDFPSAPSTDHLQIRNQQKEQQHTEDSIKINGIRVQLLNNDLWQEFKKLGNEMMVMPRSRRIFPGKIYP